MHTIGYNVYIDADAEPYITKGKRKYLMPMNKRIRKRVEQFTRKSNELRITLSRQQECNCHEDCSLVATRRIFV